MYFNAWVYSGLNMTSENKKERHFRETGWHLTVNINTRSGRDLMIIQTYFKYNFFFLRYHHGLRVPS